MFLALTRAEVRGSITCSPPARRVILRPSSVCFLDPECMFGMDNFLKFDEMPDDFHRAVTGLLAIRMLWEVCQLKYRSFIISKFKCSKFKQRLIEHETQLKKTDFC